MAFSALIIIIISSKEIVFYMKRLEVSNRQKVIEKSIKHAKIGEKNALHIIFSTNFPSFYFIYSLIVVAFYNWFEWKLRRLDLERFREVQKKPLRSHARIINERRKCCCDFFLPMIAWFSYSLRSFQASHYWCVT